MEKNSRLVVQDLALVERENGYSKGMESYEQILRAALTLLIEEGSKSLSMRRVARQCDMKIGNLTYYFPTREAMIQEMLDAVIHSYELEFESIMDSETSCPEERLQAICSLIIEDLGSKKTTRLFPELWALANHDEFIADRVHELYCIARKPLKDIIVQIRPELSGKHVHLLSLFISASMEGHTMFVGYNKAFNADLEHIKNIAMMNFVAMVKTISADDIDGLNLTE